MKWLILGGAHQGKLDYVLRYGEIDPEQVIDGVRGVLPADINDPVINHLHLLAEELMSRGIDPLEVVPAYLDRCGGWTVVCDEVGSGIVPVNPQVNRWRETVGELLILLAARANRVDRVLCGLPQRIKDVPEG